MKHALLAAAMVLGMSGTAYAHDAGHENGAGEAHEHAEKCEKCTKEGKTCECADKAAKKDCGCGKSKKKDKAAKKAS